MKMTLRGEGQLVGDFGQCHVGGVHQADSLVNLLLCDIVGQAFTGFPDELMTQVRSADSQSICQLLYTDLLIQLSVDLLHSRPDKLGCIGVKAKVGDTGGIIKKHLPEKFCESVKGIDAFDQLEIFIGHGQG